jgi:hypothetical protein
MKTIQLTAEQAEQLVAVLRESVRTTYLDGLATLEDCDKIVQLTSNIVEQV